MEAAIAKESEEPREELNLALKEGQTIKVNINIPKSKKAKDRARSPAQVSTAGGAGIGNPPGVSGVLPPPKVNMQDAVAAAGIKVSSSPRLSGPPTKAANPNWIQF